MSEQGSLDADAMTHAGEISRLVLEAKKTVAVAESLTSGTIAKHLGAAESASEWFRGGVVAYASEVKFEILGVEPGPVITAACARQMARGVADLLKADFTVAVTGAGGPGPEEGKPEGTVFLAAYSAITDEVREHHFDGEADEIVRATTVAALELLHEIVMRECA